MRYVINDFGEELEIDRQVANVLLKEKRIAEHDYNPDDDPKTREFFLTETEEVASQVRAGDPEWPRVVEAWNNIKRRISELARRPTVVVYVEGGTVQDVHANIPGVDIIVHDQDAIEAGEPAPTVPLNLWSVL